MKKIFLIISFLLSSCSTSKNFISEGELSVISDNELIEQEGNSYLYSNKSKDYEVIIKGDSKDRLVPIKLSGKPMNEKTWPGNTAKGAEVINGEIVLWWTNPNADEKIRIIQTRHTLCCGEYLGGRPVDITIDSVLFKQTLKY